LHARWLATDHCQILVTHVILCSKEQRVDRLLPSVFHQNKNLTIPLLTLAVFPVRNHKLKIAQVNIAPACWKMWASATMASLKFSLQDPPQAAATAATTTTPQFLLN